MFFFNIQLKQIYKKSNKNKSNKIYVIKKTDNHKYIFITVMKPDVDATMLAYNKTWRLVGWLINKLIINRRINKIKW